MDLFRGQNQKGTIRYFDICLPFRFHLISLKRFENAWKSQSPSFKSSTFVRNDFCRRRLMLNHHRIFSRICCFRLYAYFLEKPKKLITRKAHISRTVTLRTHVYFNSYYTSLNIFTIFFNTRYTGFDRPSNQILRLKLQQFKTSPTRYIFLKFTLKYVNDQSDKGNQR